MTIPPDLVPEETTWRDRVREAIRNMVRSQRERFGPIEQGQPEPDGEDVEQA